MSSVEVGALAESGMADGGFIEILTALRVFNFVSHDVVFALCGQASHYFAVLVADLEGEQETGEGHCVDVRG